jgi:Tfp pilus tip-associated adhesin PilY1
VWRIELDDPDPQHWQLSVLARLGGAGTSARKFLYPPDVVRYDRGHAVLLGSGDREHPFDSLSRNRFFMVKDEGGHRSVTCDTESDTCDLADASLASTPPDNPDGWYYPLEPGESVSGSGTTWAGTVYFATRRMAVADPLACHGNPDVSRLYALNYLTAAPAWPEQSRYRETSGAMPQTPALLAIASQPDATPGQATATPPESTSVRRGILAGDTVESVAIPESARKMERLWWYRESENPP